MAYIFSQTQIWKSRIQTAFDIRGFLSANSLIHMDKIGKMLIFKSKIDFSNRGPKLHNVFTANNEGDLCFQILELALMIEGNDV